MVRQSAREEIERSVCRCLSASKPYAFAHIGGPDVDRTVVPEMGDEIDAGSAMIGVEGTAPVDAGESVLSGEAHVIQNIDESFEPPGETTKNPRSACFVPLTYEQTEYGVLAVYSHRQGAFEATERDGSPNWPALSRRPSTLQKPEHGLKSASARSLNRSESTVRSSMPLPTLSWSPTLTRAKSSKRTLPPKTSSTGHVRRFSE